MLLKIPAVCDVMPWHLVHISWHSEGTATLQNVKNYLLNPHSVIFQKTWIFRWAEHNKRNKRWVVESYFHHDHIYDWKTINQQHYSVTPVTIFLFITFIRPILNSYPFTSAHLYPTYIKALKSSSLFVDPNLNNKVG